MATRDVQFIIRARDEASSAFESLSGALQQLSGWNGKAGESSNILSTDLGKLVGALGSVDQVTRLVGGASQRAGTAFDSQRAKVKSLEGDLANLKAQAAAAQTALSNVKGAGAATGNAEETAAQVTAIEAAQKQLNNQIELTGKKLNTARGELDKLGTEYQRAASLANALDAAQPGIKQAQDAGAAAQALQEQSAWVERIRQDMNPVVAIQQHFREEIEKANAAFKAGLMTEQEHLAVTKMLSSEQKKQLAQQGLGPTGRPTMLGLTPWQATNLSYQVNDVVSGLAMGQKPSQIIAQQLGQIVQLFPKLGSGIMSAFSNPYLLGAAAIFGAIAFAAKQAADQAERLRVFAAVLKANADGANYSAQALNDNVKALKAYHLSADEAVAITRTFIKDGLNPAYFERFGMAAKDMSRVLGVDVKEAAQQIGEAFTGGYDSIVKLDEATNFLTAAEREHIRTLFDSGHAADARKEAFDKFAKSQHDAAEVMRGPWAQANDHLSASWEHLKQSLADSTFANSFKNFLQGVATVVDGIADGMDRIRKSPGDFPDSQGSPTTASGAKPKNAFGQNGNSVLSLVAKNNENITAQRAADQKALDTAKTEIDLQRELQNATSDSAKAKIAGEQAYRAEIEKTGNQAVADVKRQAAEYATLNQIQMQRRQGLLSSAEGFLGKRENVREDRATLEGLFTQFGVKTPQGGTVDPQKLAWCAAFVNAMLASKGLPTTGSLAASSFKSYGQGVKLEEAQPGDIVVLNGHVGFFAGFGPNGTVRILGGNQGKPGQGAVTLSNFKRSAVQSVRRVGGIGEGFDGQDSEAQYAMQQAAAQESFNHKLEIEAAQRALVIKFMRDQLGMSAQQLYDSQKQEEIEKAIVAAKQEATDKNLTFSSGQETALRKDIGDQYDAEHAMQLVNDRIREQTDLRSALMAGIQEAAAHGDDATVAVLTEQLHSLTPALDDAIASAEEFWKKLPDSPAKTAALEGFRELRDSVKDLDFQLVKARVDAADIKVQGAESLRDALTQHIDQSQLLGDKQGAADGIAQLEQVNDQAVKLIQNLIDAKEGWLELSDAQLAGAGTSRDAIEAQILQLKDSQHQAQLLGRQYLMTGRQINESIADLAVGAIQNFQQEVQSGTPVITAFWHSIVSGVAQFLEQIGLAIIKQVIFNAISGGQPGGGGGFGGGLAGFIGGLFGKHHDGGIAGSPTQFGVVSPAVFSQAMRYHSGGLAGLAPDEVPAILRKGEEVLTESDARHRKNGGRNAPGSQRGLRQVLAFGDDEIAKAMAGAAGEDVFLTHLQRNRATVRQMLSD